MSFLRPIIIFIFLSLVSATLHGQDIKVKKNTIYRGKKALAKFEGRTSINRGINLNFWNMDGELLFNLRHVSLETGVPILPDIHWQEIKFSKSEKKIKSFIEQPFSSKKKIVKVLLERMSVDFLDPEVAFSEREKNALASDSTTSKVEADSASTVQQKNAIINRLRNTFRVQRNVRGSIAFSRISFEPVVRQSGLLRKYKTVEKNQIIQSGRIIGYITKEREAGYNAALKKGRRYIVYSKLEEPLELDGNRTDELIVASLEVDVDGVNAGSEIRTFKDNKRHSINGPGDAKIDNWERPYESVVAYLVRLGYL